MPRMAQTIRVELTPETKRRLDALPKGLSKEEFVRTFNKIIRTAGYNVVKKELGSKLDDRYSLGRAGGLSSVARVRGRQTGVYPEVVVRGSRMPLVRFMTDKGQGDIPPTVNVAEGNKSLQRGDFYARVNLRAQAKDGVAKHAGMIFRPEAGRYERRYKLGKVTGQPGRGKIRGLLTVSVPNAMEAPQIKEPMQDAAAGLVRDALEKAVDKAFATVR